MDNIKLVTLLSDYGIFCLERQKQVLAAYRKLRREYLDLTFIILCMVISFATVLASISLAVTGYLDGWVPVLLTITIGAFIALLVMALKATLSNIDEHKRFIAESCDISNTMTDIADLLNLLNEQEDDEQC